MNNYYFIDSFKTLDSKGIKNRNRIIYSACILIKSGINYNSSSKNINSNNNNDNNNKSNKIEKISTKIVDPKLSATHQDIKNQEKNNAKKEFDNLARVLIVFLAFAVLL